MLSATSSQGSAAGASPSGSQDGPTTVLFGPDPVRASLSARQAEERGLLMSGTSGRIGTTSSASASLQSSLESKLQVATASVGSTLYTLTWKPRATPSGLRICALRASARRISDSGSGSSESGWPTPTTNPAAIEITANAAEKEIIRKGPTNNLGVAAHVSGWPTPVSRDHFPAHSGEYIEAKKAQGHGMSNLNDTVQVAGWPTPTAQDGSRGNGTIRPQDTGIPLPQRAAMAGPARLTATGEMLTGSSAEMESGGQLNPRFSGWLMGYSTTWCEAALSSQQLTRSRKGKSAE
jgi:hypothetical protein